MDTITTNGQQITVLGLGAMGSALALSFLKAGLETHVWNRTADRPGVKKMIDSGGHLKETVTSALEASSLTIICLYDYDSIYAALANTFAQALKSKTIVNLTNGTPSEARGMSSWMHGRGTSHYFDGGIMSTPEQLGTPYAFTLISGEDEEAFQKISGPLSNIGRLDYLCSEPGAAALYDIASLAGMYGLFGGTLTAIALLSKSQPSDSSNASTPTTISSKLIPMLQALLPSLAETAQHFDQQDWRGHTANIGVQEGGLRNVLATCEAEEVDSRLLRAHHELLVRALMEGREAEGMAGLVRDLVKK